MEEENGLLKGEIDKLNNEIKVLKETQHALCTQFAVTKAQYDKLSKGQKETEETIGKKAEENGEPLPEGLPDSVVTKIKSLTEENGEAVEARDKAEGALNK